MENKPTTTTVKEFSGLRAALWPIHGYEMKKFLPMGLIMFFILFVYTILRDTKDTLIVTAAGGGAEVIPFLKAYVTLPAAILFVLLYSKLANIMDREKLFYLIVGSFVAFFGTFAFIMYPAKELIHPTTETISALQEAMPNLKFLFPVWGMWTYSAFYVLSELWGSVMISLLFWQFANEITRTKEAKRFYAMFGLLANISLICSGFTIRYFSDIRAGLAEGVDPWGVSLNYMMSAVVLSGLAIMVIYRWMNTNVLTDPVYYDAAEAANKPKKEKVKLSIMDSFKYLAQSKYLRNIAILVIGYGFAINLVEIIWKNQLKLAYPNSNDYSTFMGTFSAVTGIVTMTLIMLFKGIVGKFGWLRGALITPVMVLVTAALFFGFILFSEELNPIVSMFGVTTIMMAVMVGAAQNILSKGTKYSLFDPTKEMAYIPLDDELKVKGKAAVDVIGGRLGKASGGYVISGLLIMTAGTISTITGFLAVVVLGIVIAWIISVRKLSKMYNALTGEQEREAIAKSGAATKPIRKTA